ncbi:unnamed protein product [Brassicogethes aeneus]|uniref:Uncharacterized protein n=1 Tax=Brassicogethes aeneus TaxID=1431903 RepID=A0A9P0B489_BRAAE|nr:unnamed protein product [Brassicogethes aeneus]
MEIQNIDSSKGIPWMDDFSNQSTSFPEVLKEETSELGTVIIFVISAVLTITLLFVIAIFIDCRQQKLTNHQLEVKKKRKFLRIPRLKRIVEDEDTLTDAMEQPSTSASVIV